MSSYKSRLVKVITAVTTVLLFTSSCSDQSSSDKSRLSLVGGQTTTLRPEVGLFRGCTATLIHARYALTAAHCLTDYADTVVSPGDTFSGTTAAGVAYSVGVNRIYSFARYRYEPSYHPKMTTDIALLRLDQNVSPDIAPASAIADIFPLEGQRSTLFGFGCSNREPVLAGVGKQYFSFDYGTPTFALCFGDSGGPAFFGEATQNQHIWGVNSDYDGAGDFVTWTDRWADVPGYKNQILQVIAAWEGNPNLIPGVNFAGADYFSTTLAPGASGECRRLCTESTICRAFTFVDNGSSGVCYLKQRQPGWEPCFNCVSGTAPRMERGYDRPGGDYKILLLPEPRPELCLSECAADEMCSSYTYGPPSGSSSAHCWLKSAIPTPTPVAGLISGVRRSREYNVSRTGSDYQIMENLTLSTCETSCRMDYRCASYSFQSATGRCWLKDTRPSPLVTPGFISAPRLGLEMHVDRPGMDYRSFDVDPPLVEVCQATCAFESQCRSFTFFRGNQALKPHCWLKTGVPAAVVKGDVISGIKGAEFF